MGSVHNIFIIHTNGNKINEMKETKYEYKYYICVETGQLKFSIPTFKDDNLTFHAKGIVREDTTKKFGIHLC